MRVFVCGLILLIGVAWSVPSFAAPPAGCTTASVDGKAIYQCINKAYPQLLPVTCIPYVPPGYANGNAFDLYLPTTYDAQTKIKLPLVIWVHGGSWGGDKASEINFAMSVAARGHVVANINYRTTCGPSGWPNPQMVADVKDFAAFARAGFATMYKIDTTKISIGGTSAGAHLALMEATQGARLYRNVFVGAAPTKLDTIFNESSFYKAGKDAVTTTFVGSNTVQHAMGVLAANSPFNRVGYLWTEGLYMEYSTGDNLVPDHHSSGFAAAARGRSIPVFEQSYVTSCGSAPDHCMPSPAPGLGLLAFIDRNGGTLSSAAAKQELAGWPSAHVVDGDQTTVYSSPLADRYNSAGHFLAAWSNLRRSTTSVEPIWVDTLIMRARVAPNGQPLAFPKSYGVYVTNPSNTAWVNIGQYTTQPNALGEVAINIGLKQTHGVLLVPNELGQDDVGGYYFQMADLHLQRM